jgi:hypothetical protein
MRASSPSYIALDRMAGSYAVWKAQRDIGTMRARGHPAFPQEFPCRTFWFSAPARSER